MNSNTCFVDQYRIKYRIQGTSSWSQKTMSAPVGSCTFPSNKIDKRIGNLTSSSTYEYQMKAWYCGGGAIDGPIVTVNGRVGWSCAENMMAGKVVIEKNAGSCFGAAIRGGDLICKGSVGARTGIDQKGGSIIVGGDAGAFTGFMMQRGRIVILGDVGINLGDSMYDGTIYVGGKIGSFGSDAVEAPMTKNDIEWLTRKLKVAEIGSNVDLSKMTKVVAGKKLWNYDALEPTERKGAI